MARTSASGSRLPCIVTFVNHAVCVSVPNMLRTSALAGLVMSQMRRMNRLSIHTGVGFSTNWNKRSEVSRTHCPGLTAASGGDTALDEIAAGTGPLQLPCKHNCAHVNARAYMRRVAMAQAQSSDSAMHGRLSKWQANSDVHGPRTAQLSGSSAKQGGMPHTVTDIVEVTLN
jgi:hypothetical protein